MGPEILEGGRYASTALHGSVAQAHQPAAAVAQMVAGLLHRLGSDRRQTLIRRRRQPFVKLQLKGVDEHLTHDGSAEVAVRLLGQGRVQIFAMLPQEGDLILVAARPSIPPAEPRENRAMPIKSSPILANPKSPS